MIALNRCNMLSYNKIVTWQWKQLTRLVRQLSKFELGASRMDKLFITKHFA